MINLLDELNSDFQYMKMNREDMKKWAHVAEYFRSEALPKNPCLSRQIGCIIVDPYTNSQISAGHNGPPTETPCCDDEEYLRNVLWPQLTDEERSKALMNIEGFSFYKKQNESELKEVFCEKFAGCSECPRRLIGAPSGQRLELCTCLSYESKILLSDGTWAKIGELADNKYSGYVKSYNLESGIVENKKVIGWYCNDLSEDHIWFRFKTKYSKKNKKSYIAPKFTGDHLILTENGWKRADAIKVGDKVLTDGKSLDNLEKSGIFLDEVEFIENLSKEKSRRQKSYCIDVEDNHNFICQGFIAHNCVHGETSAIVNAQRSVVDMTMFCACGVPCVDCTKLILQSRLSSVFCVVPLNKGPEMDYSPYVSRWLFEKSVDTDLYMGTPEWFGLKQ